MKKLLTAALLLLGVLWIPLQAAADVSTALEAGKFYKFKAYSDQTKYLDLVTTGKPDSGSNASVSTTERVVYVDKTKTENGVLKVQIRATSEETTPPTPGNILWANRWNSRIDATSTDFYWHVKDAAVATADDGNPVIRLYQDSSGNPGYLGYQTTLTGNKAGCLYSDCGVTASNCTDWIVIPYEIAVPKTNLTLIFSNGATRTEEVMVGLDASLYVPANTAFATYTLQESNTIIAADNNTFHVTVVENMPFAVSPSTGDLRWQALSMAPWLNLSRYLAYQASSNHIEYSAATFDKVYPDEALWAFVGNTIDGFKIYNKAAGTTVALNNSNATYVTMDAAADAKQWQIVASQESNTADRKFFTIYNGVNYANLQNSDGSYFLKYWTAPDNGSSMWRLSLAAPMISYVDANFPDKSILPGLQEAYDACVADPYDYNKVIALKTIATDLSALVTSMRSKGDAFVALGFVNDNAKALWQTAVAEKAEYTPDDLNAMKNAYHALIHSTCSPDSLISAGHAIRFKHAGNRPGCYIGFDGTKLSTTDAAATANKRAMLMIPVATGGFKLFHEATAKYLKMPTADNSDLPVVDSEADATVWVLEPYQYDPTSAAIQLKALGDFGGHNYIHTNGSERVVRWEPGGGSSWYLEGVDGLTAAKSENLQPAYDSFRAVGGTFGSAVGQYSGTPITTAQVDALIANADATIDDVHTMAANLRVAFSFERLNKPVPGRFYRIKNLETNSYIKAANTSDRIALTATESESFIFIDAQNRFVAYPSGLVMGKFADSDDASAKYLLSTDDKASTGVTFASTPGAYGNKFELQPSAGRYLKAENGQITSAATAGTGTSWEFTEATWLPVFTDATTKMATIYSPVELSRTAAWSTDRFNAWRITEVLPSGLALYAPIEGNIPANTPVLVQNIASDYYLKIEYTPTVATPEGSNALSGSYYAAAKPADQTTFIGGKPNGVNGLVALTADILPGFTAAVAIPTAEAAEAYKFFTGTFVPGKLYTINNTESIRGALIYDAAHTDDIWTTGKASVALDATNPNHLWGVYIDADGNKYLYNVGAKKFASAYSLAADPAITDISGNIDFFWGLRSVATPVTMPEDALTTRILGGENSKGRPAGMMIINGWTRPVPCVSGIGSDTDGNRFAFTAAATPASKALLAEIETIFQGQEAALAARRVYPFEAQTATDEETFGYYPASVKNTFENSLGDNTEPTAKLYYKAEQAQAAAQVATRTGFINGHAYELSDDAGAAYHFEEVRNSLSNVVTNATMTNAMPDPNFYKWIAEVNTDNQVTLYQNWGANSYYYGNKEGGRRDFAWQTPEATLFNVVFADEAGKAYLRPVVATPAALNVEEVPFSISHSSADSNITTGISFVTEAASDAPCYDLQGRRVSTTTRGLIIQSGRILRK